MSKSLVIISSHMFYEEKIRKDKVLKSGQGRALGERSFLSESRTGVKAPKPDHGGKTTRRQTVYV